VVQDAETVWQALRLFEQSKADFADCLVERMAAAAGCVRTVTFDKAAAIIGMTLL
jgi:predicted nucleic-acid-binding protein